MTRSGHDGGSRVGQEGTASEAKDRATIGTLCQVVSQCRDGDAVRQCVLEALATEVSSMRSALYLRNVAGYGFEWTLATGRSHPAWPELLNAAIAMEDEPPEQLWWVVERSAPEHQGCLGHTGCAAKAVGRHARDSFSERLTGDRPSRSHPCKPTLSHQTVVFPLVAIVG
jgi:hypothetical protein